MTLSWTLDWQPKFLGALGKSVLSLWRNEKDLEQTNFPKWRGRNGCEKPHFSVLCGVRGHFTSPWHICVLFCTVLTPATGLTLIPKNPFPGYYWAIFRAFVTLFTSGNVPADS